MLTPIPKTRRTDDITVIKWEYEMDGTELQDYVIAELDVHEDSDWEVRLIPWRTISATHADGTGFGLDRGEYLARGADGKFFRLNDESLGLLFN